MSLKTSHYFFLLISTFMLLAGGGASASETESPPECSVEASSCYIFEFVSASEEVLRTNTDPIVVSCPWHFYSPPAESIQPECVELINAAVVLINNRLSESLSPIVPSDIKYSDASGCIDTFIPGREQADCYTEIHATISLVWLPKKK